MNALARRSGFPRDICIYRWKIQCGDFGNGFGRPLMHRFCFALNNGELKWYFMSNKSQHAEWWSFLSVWFHEIYSQMKRTSGYVCQMENKPSKINRRYWHIFRVAVNGSYSTCVTQLIWQIMKAKLIKVDFFKSILFEESSEIHRYIS